MSTSTPTTFNKPVNAAVRQRSRQLREDRRRAISRLNENKRGRRTQGDKDDPDTPITPAMLKVREFALVVGMDRATVYRRLADGTIRSIKIGGCRLIPYGEIQRLLAGE